MRSNYKNITKKIKKADISFVRAKAQYNAYHSLPPALRLGVLKNTLILRALALA
jgi:hypothetical protein